MFSVLANKTIEELNRRFKPEAAKDFNATFLFSIEGDNGGSWLAKINDGKCEFVPQNGNSTVEPDCKITVTADDLELIMTGRMSAMTAALSGILSIEGELGLAMKLVPIFFEGQVPFI